MQDYRNKFRFKALVILQDIEELWTKVIFDLRSQNIGDSLIKNFGFKALKNNPNAKLTLGIPDELYFHEKHKLFIDLLKASGGKDKKSLESLNHKFMAFNLREIRNKFFHSEAVYLQEYKSLIEYIELEEYVKLGFDLSKTQLLLNKIDSSDVDDLDFEKLLNKTIHWPEKIEVKNNLPNYELIEHYHTGLIGRKANLERLASWLFGTKYQLLAVSGRGGTGKTALVLEFLNRVLSSDSLENQFDGVVFVNLKDEVLQVDGIKKIKDDPTILSLQEEIINEVIKTLGDTSASSIEDFEDRRILLFIDNLEKIIADKPEVFQEFWETQIPSKWKVIVTSRIPITFSQNEALEDLNADEMKVLCEACFTNYSDYPLNDLVIKKITNAAKGNPLALKYFVELIYRGGYELDEAAALTESNILAFSFSHLADGLTPNELKILAALSVLGGSRSRVEVCEVCDITSDEFRVAYNKIKFVSLIELELVDSEPSERYKLSRIAQEYVLRSEQLDLYRKAIDSKYKLLKIKSQQKSGDYSDSDFNHDYISPNTPIELKTLILKLLSSLEMNDTRELRGGHLVVFKSKESLYESFDSYYYYLGLIYSALDSDADALSCFKKAIELNPKSNIYQLKYASKLRSLSNLNDALDYLKPLISKGFHTPDSSSQDFADKLISEYCRCLIYMNQYSEVLNFTSEWKTAQTCNRAYGIARAICLKRIAEEYVKTQSKYKEIVESCSEQVQILEELLNNPENLDYLTTIQHEIGRFITLCCTTIHSSRGSADEVIKILGDFLEKNMTRIVLPKTSEYIMAKYFSNIVNKNLEPKITEQLALDKTGAIITLSRDLSIHNDFTFAKDSDGKSYYIPRTSYSFHNSTPWEKLTSKSKLRAVKFEASNGSADFKVTLAILESL